MLTASWAACVAVMVVRFPDPPRAVVYASLLYVAYYAAMSAWLTMEARGAAAAEGADTSGRNGT